MIIYVIIGYEQDGSSSIFGENAYLSKAQAEFDVKRLSDIFTTTEFFVEEFGLETSQFQKSLDNVQ